ncbi:MAG: DUF3048 domain-containing protein [Clostridiales Family XIII bacterium]|jgi:hypothetical protein|nr:DUF3048 domain-containing protein [Clostridiales Family XIII bacterium]
MRIKKIIPTALLILCMVFAVGCGSETDTPAASGSSDPAAVVTEPEPEPPAGFYYPLTGLEAPSLEATQKRPISVKIENSSDSRPQLGLNRADVVYETRVEGGETRCNALWQSDVPDDVGNVRSARLSDHWIVPQYSALFFNAGGNNEYDAGIPLYINYNMSYHFPEVPYYRTSNRVAPHNLYLDLSEIYDVAEDLGYPSSTDNVKGLYFGDHTTADGAVPASGSAKAAASITITYANYSEAHWDWDAAKKVYLRTQGGKVHTDAETGDQVFSTNVVLLFADYSLRGALDPAGNPTWDIDMGGTGKVIVCKDGKQYEGKWQADRNTPPIFIGADGQQIPLNPGNTWIEVPAQDTPVTVE